MQILKRIVFLNAWFLCNFVKARFSSNEVSIFPHLWGYICKCWCKVFRTVCSSYSTANPLIQNRVAIRIPFQKNSVSERILLFRGKKVFLLQNFLCLGIAHSEVQNGTNGISQKTFWSKSSECFSLSLNGLEPVSKSFLSLNGWEQNSKCFFTSAKWFRTKFWAFLSSSK